MQYSSLQDKESAQYACENIALADDPDPHIEWMLFCLSELNAGSAKAHEDCKKRGDMMREYIRLYNAARQELDSISGISYKGGEVCQCTTTCAPKGILSRVADRLMMRR